MGKIDPLAAWVQQSPIQALIAAVILLVFCALLVRQQRRLAALQTQLDSLNSDIRRLEVAHEGLLVHFMNLPRSRRARKSSAPLSDTLKESVAPKQSDEKSKVAALYVVAPKTPPE